VKPSRTVQRGFKVHPDWASALENVHIVLVGTTHAGNIGAVARVMKNTGLRKLTLVSSTHCGPETEAQPTASGAYEIVEQARSLTDVPEALDSMVMVVGASGRLGRKRVTALTPEEVVPELMDAALSGPVACVFGRESRGLTNDELKLCTHHMIIPTDARFASMNLAHAVAVTGYEIFRRGCRPMGFRAQRFQPASNARREEMFAHIETVLIRAGFLDRANPLGMMRDLRRIFNSARIDDRDVTIIRGIFRKMDTMIRLADEKIRRLEESGGANSEV